MPSLQLPFSIYNDRAISRPVVLSVPHAGRDYGVMAVQLRVPLRAARPLEDRFADALVETSIAAGTTAIVADVARLVIDLNRAPDDLDCTAMRSTGLVRNTVTSTKARSGLGLVPTRLPTVGNLWKQPLELEVVEERLRQIHRPYHAAIGDALDRVKACWGRAILLDIHSMPSIGRNAGPDVVLGDGFGTTASREIVDTIQCFLTSLGFQVDLNAPYAGGYVVRRHGRPTADIHAIQLEFDRALYLDNAQDEPSLAVLRVQNAVEGLVDALTYQFQRTVSIAAE